MAKNTTNGNGSTFTVDMPRGKECKSVIRFESTDPEAPVSNVYVSRKLAGVNDAKAVKVTVEVVPA